MVANEMASNDDGSSEKPASDGGAVGGEAVNQDPSHASSVNPGDAAADVFPEVGLDDEPGESTLASTESTPPAEGGAEPGSEEEVIEVLQTIFDPEIPVNIYELGLIYDVARDDSGDVRIQMTLTSPNCPVAEIMPQEVQDKVNALESVASTQVDIVWDPTWTPEKMSEEAKLELGLW